MANTAFLLTPTTAVQVWDGPASGYRELSVRLSSRSVLTPFYAIELVPVEIPVVEETNRSPQNEPEQAPTAPPRPAVVPGFPLEGPYLTGPQSKGDHWEQCLNAVEKYDNDECKSWREEIDTLLVFVRVFFVISVSSS